MTLAQYAASRRAQMMCKRGHPLAAQNLRLSKEGYRICKQCANDRLRRRRSEGTIGPIIARRIVEAVNEGWTRHKITLKILPSVQLSSWLRANPKLQKRLAPKFKINRLKSHSDRRLILTLAPAIQRNNGHDAFDAIQAATRHLFEPLRGTVQSDMWLDVAEARLTISEIPGRVADYVRKYNRDEKHSVASRWGNRSLDAAIGANGFNLLDVTAATDGWSPIAFNTGRHVSSAGRAI